MGGMAGVLTAAAVATACATAKAPEQGPATPATTVSTRAIARTESPSDAQSDGPWVFAAEPDLRRLTVLIRAKPPSDLVAKYRELARRNQRMKAFFDAAADGGFGSGFVVVRRSSRERTATDDAADPLLRFIVTNQHVVALASRVTVSFQGTNRELELPVIHVDPDYDLAILSLDQAADGAAAADALPQFGFDFETKPPKDQDPVVASGYPGIGQSPSYQVTRGYVSNERFELTEFGRTLPYVQHTAPIDPGSSGGPLLTVGGRLLGVNTLKVRLRENVGFSVPARAVAAAVERASRLRTNASRVPSLESARATCNTLLADLARGEAGVGGVERALGAPMLARDGFASLDALPERDERDWVQAFLESPTQVFVHAIALRLMSESARPNAGTSAVTTPSCTDVPSDGQTETFSFTVTSRRGARAWTFAQEQGRYKLVQAQLARNPRNEAFFRDFGEPKGPRKKWTPTLR
jgi:serine protease Do